MPKISALTAASVMTLTDEFAANQGGTTKKITGTIMNTFNRDNLVSNLTPGSVLFVNNAHKISEDVGKFNFDNVNETLAVGASATTLTINGTTKDASILGISNGQAERWGLSSLSYGTGIECVMSMHYARGSQASPSGVKAGDQVGRLCISGYADTDFRRAGDIRWEAIEDFTSLTSGAFCEIRTTPTGSNTPLVGFTVNSDQTIKIPKTLSINTDRTKINLDGSDASVGIYIKESPTIAAMEVVMTSYGAGRTNGISYCHANGTEAAPTAAVASDYIRYDTMYGYDGSTFRTAAQSGTIVDGAVSAGIVPTRFFWLTQDTTGAYDVRMILKNDGKLGLGTQSPADILHLYGNVTGSGLRARIENIDTGTNKNAGLITKNTNKEIFAGISYSGSVNHWTVYDNTSAVARLRYDLDNDGLIVGDSGTTVSAALFNVNGANQKVKYFTNFSDSSTNAFVAINHGNGNPAQIACAAANGTIASPTIVVNGQTTLQLAGFGYDGATYRASATIKFEINGTPGTSEMPGLIRLQTRAAGGSQPADAVIIDSGQEATFTAGVKLPTSGGTPSLLNFYEVYTYSATITSTLFDTAYTIDLKIVRLGQMVTISWYQFLQSQSTGSADDVIQLVVGSYLPARFRPLQGMNTTYGYFNNAANFNDGSMTVGSDGNITFGKSPISYVPHTWNSGSNFILYGGSITYYVS